MMQSFTARESRQKQQLVRLQQEQGEMNAYTLVAQHRVQNQGMVLPTLNPGLQYQLR